MQIFSRLNNISLQFYNICFRLHKKNIALEAKDFALGVLVEHPQALIDGVQYHARDAADREDQSGNLAMPGDRGGEQRQQPAALLAKAPLFGNPLRAALAFVKMIVPLTP